MKNIYGSMKEALFPAAAIALLALSSGCTFTSRPRVDVQEIEVAEQYSRTDKGVVEYVWEEPMVDVVEIPPGLDPEGHYYRPSHHEVVEIRQGRWRYHKPGSVE